ncbi:MAG: hypothetical protein IKO06_01425 [Alphaproteobacteria bacterium]|nr:hypothetical protein [Alphaproteobacteria bacterium]
MKTLVKWLTYFMRGTLFFFVLSVLSAAIVGKCDVSFALLACLFCFASMSLITAALIGFMCWLQYRRELNSQSKEMLTSC